MGRTINDLKLAAQKAILDDSRTKEHDIEALDDNGVIPLKRSVPAREISEAAEKVTGGIFGVTSVVNSLEVRKSIQGNLV